MFWGALVAGFGAVDLGRVLGILCGKSMSDYRAASV
jgi:hypothetical protein